MCAISGGVTETVRPKVVHVSQGLKLGLYTPTILGGNSYLSWFYDRWTIKDPAHIQTSKGLSQAINMGPIRKILPKYANVYVTIHGHGLSTGARHGLSTGARTHYVTANGVKNGQRDGARSLVWLIIAPGPGNRAPGRSSTDTSSPKKSGEYQLARLHRPNCVPFSRSATLLPCVYA